MFDASSQRTLDAYRPSHRTMLDRLIDSMIKLAELYCLLTIAVGQRNAQESTEIPFFASLFSFI